MSLPLQVMTFAPIQLQDCGHKVRLSLPAILHTWNKAKATERQSNSPGKGRRSYS